MDLEGHGGQVCSRNADKYLFLKELALLRGQSVGFRNKGDDVDFVMKPLHELDVQRLQTEKWNRRHFHFIKANVTKERYFSSSSSSFLFKQPTNM